MSEVPEYSALKASALDPHLEGIVERRQKKWPYQAILKWLKEEHEITIVYSTLWEFCQRRGIKKGAVAPPQPPGVVSTGHESHGFPAMAGMGESQPEPLDFLTDAQSRLAADEPENPFVKVPHRSLSK
jgi:hypothetical protein